MVSEKLNVPEHVTIIMDGNGRWAKQRGQERLYGHKEGVESVRACTELAVEKGIKYLSVFAFSEENWDRPVAEIEGLNGDTNIPEKRCTFPRNRGFQQTFTETEG